MAGSDAVMAYLGQPVENHTLLRRPSPAARNAAYGSFTRRYALVSGRRDRHGIALGPAEATARHGANAKSNSDRLYSSLGALPYSARILKTRVAVGTRVTSRPPHRSVRAAFPHTAPTLGV